MQSLQPPTQQLDSVLCCMCCLQLLMSEPCFMYKCYFVQAFATADAAEEPDTANGDGVPAAHEPDLSTCS